MEYLIFAIILYFILKTGGNLFHILQGGPYEDERSTRSESRRNWEGPSPRKETGRLQDQRHFWIDEIEDASWHDLNERR